MNRLQLALEARSAARSRLEEADAEVILALEESYATRPAAQAPVRDGLLTAAEAAEYLRVSRRVVDKRAQDGELAYVLVGSYRRYRRYRREDLDAYAARRAHEARPSARAEGLEPMRLPEARRRRAQ